ncbi:MAG: amidohydrolase family protein [Oscillospiraceae bacterium]
MLLLKNATIYPQTDEAPFVGDVLCEDGKIVKVGKALSADGAEVLDLTGLNLLPGLVDCHSHAGLCPPGGAVGALSYGTDTVNPVSPEMDTLYSADPMNPCYRYALENGVTTLGVIPGSSAIIDGTGFATRTWGENIFEMCLKRNMCLKLSLGENPKGCFQNQGKEPDSRMGVTFILEEYFTNAKAYMEKKESGVPVAYNEKYEVAIPVLKREIPARIHCTHNDMAAAIQILSKFGLRFTIEHAWGAGNYLDEIAESGCTIVYGPVGGRRSFYESRFVDIDAVAKLDRRGVKCCLTVDSPLEGLDALLSHMEQAVREGADPLHVMRMVTIHPAEVLGLQERVGTIEAGKDANFAVFKGVPGTDMGAHVVCTIGEGEIKYKAAV